MATVQLFRREARDFAAFDEIDRAHRDANVQSIFYYAVFYPAIELVSALAASLIIWVGGGWVMQDALTLGSLVAFLQYSQRFFRPISDLSEKFNVLQGAMASSERIFALLDTPVEIASPTHRRRTRRCDRSAGRQRPPAGAVRRDPVRERHLRLRRGRAGAAGRVVRGRAGPARRASSAPPARARRRSSACCCGSTTCSSGRITIDGVDIREIDLARLRATVRPGAAGRASVLRHDRRQRPAGQRRRSATRRCGARVDAVHAAAFVDRLPQGLADAGGGARRDAVGRAEAAAVVRAGAGVRPARADPRRGDVERRHRDRAADPRRAQGA